MILRVIDTSHTTVHFEGRYNPNKSIINITVLLVQAYFIKKSTTDIVQLMKLHKDGDNAIHRILNIRIFIMKQHLKVQLSMITLEVMEIVMLLGLPYDNTMNISRLGTFENPDTLVRFK
ncbi:hypothetical protein C922_05128 [Plasmodium inui San Antonio 1]|uniref:Uncharacterized protein n=1 Tax=Plasmodium inui San Antonio 1 TaxID=1237626 RepID=W6ZYQ8_9APIC|nr:hypothetical protein C922_05128 [Plasmodium inui San Antonio 1]EUD64488.1 hypothetical protein C922_05128 [Plasmodium inui San Antonio 1]